MTIEKGKTFGVLDKGYVKVIDWMGSEETIIDAARMSSGKGFISWDPYKRCKVCGVPWYGNEERPRRSIEKECIDEHNWENYPRGDSGLLEFLYKNQHMTPFEMCELAIEVQAPIFVFREWHRHRTQSYNEFSARYAEMPNLHYVPDPTRLAPVKSSNKQEASSALGNIDLTLEEWSKEMANEQESVFTSYQEYLDAGIPREVSRINTPVSRYSKMRAKANLRNWLSFCMLRMAPNAQYEIREYARVVGEQVLAVIFPRVWKLFLEYDFHAMKLSASELSTLKQFLLHNPTVDEAALLKLFRKLGI